MSAATLAQAEGLLTRRELAGALQAFDQVEAEGEDPDRCSAGRWMAHVLAGDYAAAWAESDATRRRGTPDPNRFWQGEDLHGARLMVRSLHGFGDAAQMLRYAPRLAALAAEVTYEVAPPLVELAACFDGVHRVITWGEHAPAEPPAWDVQCEVMELPYLFRTTTADLPIATGYLKPPAALLAGTRAALGDAGGLRRIGLVWASGEWDPARSIPSQELEPLLAIPGFQFWNLQRGASDGLINSAFKTCGDGVLALAATIATLDLVITVDTLAAHLAGALGRPVWLMLQHAADWRWMHARADSPWYPTLRIFRQPVPGDWENVVQAVRAALIATAGRLGS